MALRFERRVTGCEKTQRRCSDFGDMLVACDSHELPCLDSEMHNFVDWGESLTHRLKAHAQHAYDGGVRAWSDPPYVEVDDPCVAWAFDLLANLTFEVWIGS